MPHCRRRRRIKPGTRRDRYRQRYRYRPRATRGRRDIWSAGHSTSGVSEILAVDGLIARTIAEYRAADARNTVSVVWFVKSRRNAGSRIRGSGLNAPLTTPPDNPVRGRPPLSASGRAKNRR
jgi:hypothetical protein